MIAVLAALGTQWTVLQSIAWTRMLAENLTTGSFTEAVQKTFDGQHPCRLCKTIAAGKQAEQKKEFTAPLQKYEFPPVNEIFTLVAPAHFQRVLPANTAAAVLPHPPLTPPPRNRCV